MPYQPFRFCGEPIVSRQNRHVVGLCKLEDRKAREETELFRFDGIKLLCEAIRRGVVLDSLFVRAGSTGQIAEGMETLYGLTPTAVDCPVYPVDNDLFARISQENAPEGVICVAKYIDKRHKKCKINRDGLPHLDRGPVILLESLRDPGNVGTVIRTAAALGVARIILSNDCADLYHPRTVRAAMGPLFSMPVTRVDDLAGAVRLLRAGGWVVNAAALDESAQRLGEVDLSAPVGAETANRPGDPGKVCAVIGNEGHGLSKAVIEACDRTVYIPMEADAESLNAGAAAALIMWEMRRAGRA